ncbi:hypothetical protein LJ739_18550 [Aestuariibacter halophilus]|uniref:Uncharacterized protein n=1 Tax=Fluctibacter halophilus TaxID=226011 RepID=A0ABS8GEQ4_9ALTE|nr:hypothetical protein [Aestuariibacter halophilus]MCC2618264.1 hypothetical protein [Aestuariibacter halophilus]
MKRGYLPLAYLIGGLLLNVWLGNLSTDTQARFSRDFNAALAFPIITAFCWWSIGHLRQVAYQKLYQVTINLQQPHRFATFSQHLHVVLRRCRWLGLGSGTVIAFTYMWVEGLLNLSGFHRQFVLNLMAWVFWMMALWLICHIILVTSLVIRRFLSARDIDLFSVGKLQPVSDLVLVHVSHTLGVLILVPLFWLGKDIPWTDVVITTGLITLLVLYVFWPVINVHQLIGIKKRQAVQRLNQSIRDLFAHSQPGKGRLTDDRERLRELSSLISAKAELNNQSEWPINLPQGIRTLLISIAVPLSWAAGSMVETLIGYLQGL